MSLNTLDHVIIAVENIDAATSVYTRLLGRSPSWRGEHPGEGSANTLFRLENTYLELLAPEGEGPVADALRARLASEGEGLLGLAFGCEDADAAHAAFDAAGLEPGAPQKGLGRDVASGAYRTWRRVPLPLARTRGVLLFAIEHESPPDILPVAAALGDEQAAVSGLDHAVVRTRDGDACKALYGEALGLRVALDRSFELWGARLIFCRVGGVTVELAAALGDAEDAEGMPGDAEHDSLWGLSLQVPDAAAARERMASQGFDVSEVRAGRKPGTFVFSVHEAPCGVATLILQPAPRTA